MGSKVWASASITLTVNSHTSVSLRINYDISSLTPAVLYVSAGFYIVVITIVSGVKNVFDDLTSTRKVYASKILNK